MEVYNPGYMLYIYPIKELVGVALAIAFLLPVLVLCYFTRTWHCLVLSSQFEKD